MFAATTTITLTVDPANAQSRPVLIVPDVAFPTTGGVARAGQNGLVIDEGVASVDESNQYTLLSLSVDNAEGVIRFVYGDAWTMAHPRPSSCVFTFRRVERTLTQTAANDLAKTLAAVELQRLKEAHQALTNVEAQTGTGAVVRQFTDRFTWSEKTDVTDADADVGNPGTATVHGLSKTWLYVLQSKAYYVNKTCFAWGPPAELTVIDQLIGLNYHRDPVA